MASTIEYNKHKAPQIRDEVYVYRLCDINFNIDGTVSRINSAVVIPPNDIIVQDGQVYDIAFIERMNPGGTPELGSILFMGSQGGTLRLNPKNAQDRKKIAYLECSNFNESNKNRDTTRQPIFRLVEDKKEALSQSERQSLIGVITSLVGKLPADQVKAGARTLGFAGTAHPECLQYLLERTRIDPKGVEETLGLSSNVAAITKLLNQIAGGAEVEEVEEDEDEKDFTPKDYTNDRYLFVSWLFENGAIEEKNNTFFEKDTDIALGKVHHLSKNKQDAFIKDAIKNDTLFATLRDISLRKGLTNDKSIFPE